eukprot:TRINITY_DN1353_c0_g2_i22.p2 TRINITY_DN1353_c0_g2~~TRINITY_DN1353_c0_g2_i22.p2  ORF type:complete len:133 (+),score=27.97 TRINITY_DN1353_c0_g2_i22:372-770(+)
MSGERTTPSYVSIHTEGNLVGITARKQALISPRNTFYHFKGLLGQSYDPETHKDGSVRYKLTAGENNSVAVQDEAGTTYSIPQITSFVLKRMKETAENNLGTAVSIRCTKTGRFKKQFLVYQFILQKNRRMH